MFTYFHSRSYKIKGYYFPWLRILFTASMKNLADIFELQVPASEQTD